MESIAATEASNRFGQLLDTAMQEPVTIEKKGRGVAVILSLDEYKRMDYELERLQNQRLTESIEDMKEGRTKAASEVFSTLKERYE